MAPPALAADRGYLVKGLAGVVKDCVALGIGLPSPHSDVDIMWIELEAVCTSTNALGCHDRGARPHKWVEDDVAAPRAIAQRVGDERDRLDCRMQSEIVHASGTERVDPGIR